MFIYPDVSFFTNLKRCSFFFNFQVSDIDALCVLPTRGNMQTSRNWKRCLAIPKFPNVVITTIQDAMTSSKSVLKTARAVLLNLKVIPLINKSLSVTSVAEFLGQCNSRECFISYISCSRHQNNQIYKFRIPNILFTCLINSRARHSAIYKLKSRNLF